MLSARSSSTLDCYRELQAGKVQIPLLFESEVLRSFRVCEFGHAASHAALRGGGLPPPFKQRLLHEGNTLEDAVKLDSVMDLLAQGGVCDVVRGFQ
eukprot:s1072_g3.t1